MTYEANNVSMWLSMLNKHPRNLVPLFAGDFHRLRELAPVIHERVIKTPEGQPRLYMVDRDKTVQLLKELYGFKTKQEAMGELNGTDL
jgi:hypothetical protein